MRPRHTVPVSRTALVSLALAAVALAGCGSASSSASNTTTTTTPTGVIPTGDGSSTTATTPTTAPAPPPDALTSPSEVSNDLIDDWVAGKRSAALSVASAAAVATLFATPYRGQTVELRGCNVNPPTPVCTFGPGGGASASLKLYELDMAQTPGGKWYTNMVTIES